VLEAVLVVAGRVVLAEVAAAVLGAGPSLCTEATDARSSDCSALPTFGERLGASLADGRAVSRAPQPAPGVAADRRRDRVAIRSAMDADSRASTWPLTSW
jgi:hypothetical protein